MRGGSNIARRRRGLFDDELIDALEQIVRTPLAAQRVSLRRGRAVRPVLLPKTAFHLYDEVVENQVRVLTLWGAVRGAPPKL